MHVGNSPGSHPYLWISFGITHVVAVVFLCDEFNAGNFLSTKAYIDKTIGTLSLMFESSSAIDTLHSTALALRDTAAVAHISGAHEGGFNFMHLLEHLKNSQSVEFPFGHVALPQFPLVHLGGFTMDLSITKHVFFLLLGGVLLLLTALYTARSYKKSLVPRGFVNLIEMVIIFFRDEVVIPNMGVAGLAYMPYVLTTCLLYTSDAADE